MPKLFEINGYKVYFWSNENQPLEPIHVHISNIPHQNATKIWLLSNGTCSLANNNDRIPNNVLKDIMEVVSFSHKEIEQRWERSFGRIDYADKMGFLNHDER